MALSRSGYDLPAGYCHTCCRDFPPETMSPDPRYCQECYNFLSKEAEMLLDRGSAKRPYWWPKNTPAAKISPLKEKKVVDAAINTTDNPPDQHKGVSKLPDKGIIPPIDIQAQIEEVVLKHPGGRPRKEGEDVSRVTKWRREKETQGVLPF